MKNKKLNWKNMDIKSKLAASFLALNFAMASVFAGNNEMAQKFHRSYIQESFYVESNSRDVADTIAQNPSYIIDHFSSEGFEVYGPAGLEETLKQLNVRYVSLEFLENKNLDKALKYPTHEQITESLKKLSLKYPKIFKLFSIGKSVQGRHLWVMKVSDNVEVDEYEPEFKYISSMHGDEIVGRELTVKLLEDLGASYAKKNARITKLINGAEFYIMPSMNPDGSYLKQRANAQGVDLNRNFPPLVIKNSGARPAARIEAIAHETNLVMNFQKTRKFSLSANFHGGAVVVNYPWDHTLTRHPLDAFIQELSLNYARFNSEMTASTEFEDGIVNGADWYVVKGGMQDWSYLKYGDLQVTIELSQEKYPSYDTIPDYYERNKESMLVYMEQIFQGAGFADKKGAFGKFKRAPTKVKIKSTEDAKFNLGPFEFDGKEFYAVLPKGRYSFELLDSTGQVVTRVARDVK